MFFFFNVIFLTKVPVMHEEIKTFIGIHIIMGINELPTLALCWSSDEFFGNKGIR